MTDDEHAFAAMGGDDLLDEDADARAEMHEGLALRLLHDRRKWPLTGPEIGKAPRLLVGRPGNMIVAVVADFAHAIFKRNRHVVNLGQRGSRLTSARHGAR